MSLKSNWAFVYLCWYDLISRLYALFESVILRYYFIFAFSFLSIVLEAHSIFTILQLVFGYMMKPNCAMSSLRCHTCYFGEEMPEINLQPWIGISSSPPTSITFLIIESAILWAVIRGILGRGTYASIRDCKVLHAERFSTFWKTNYLLTRK